VIEWVDVIAGILALLSVLIPLLAKKFKSLTNVLSTIGVKLQHVSHLLVDFLDLEDWEAKAINLVQRIISSEKPSSKDFEELATILEAKANLIVHMKEHLKELLGT